MEENDNNFGNKYTIYMTNILYGFQSFFSSDPPSNFLTFFLTMLSLCLEMGERGEMSYWMALCCCI